MTVQLVGDFFIGVSCMCYAALTDEIILQTKLSSSKLTILESYMCSAQDGFTSVRTFGSIWPSLLDFVVAPCGEYLLCYTYRDKDMFEDNESADVNFPDQSADLFVWSLLPPYNCCPLGAARQCNIRCWVANEASVDFEKQDSHCSSIIVALDVQYKQVKEILPIF